MTNYQKRENIWKFYFQLARGGSSRPGKDQANVGTFPLDSEHKCGRFRKQEWEVSNQGADKGQYRNSWARSPRHPPLLHTYRNMGAGVFTLGGKQR